MSRSEESSAPAGAEEGQARRTGAKIGDARAAGRTPNPRTVKSQGILKARVDQLIHMLRANTSPEAGAAAGAPDYTAR